MRLLTGAYLPGCPAVEWKVGNSPGSRANNIYLPDSDKLTEVELFMSTSCHSNSRVIRAFSDVEKPFLLSDLAVQAAISENKKAYQHQRRLGLAAGLAGG